MPDDFSMFDLPNQPDDNQPPADNTQKPSAETVTFTREQWDQMQSQWAAERQRNTEMFAQIFQGQHQQQPAQPGPAVPQLVLDGLPDPRDDFEGYNKGLAERLGQTVSQIRQQVAQEIQQQSSQQQETANLWDRAWNRFSELHKDLAEFPELVQVASSQAIEEYSQRRVDPMFVLRTNMDDMVNKVAANTKALVDRIRGAEGSGDNDPGRTRMLDGGGPKPRGRQAQRETSQPDDLIASIKKMQSEMRIY